MPNAIEAVNASERHDHLVQFYSSPETLAETAGHFISEGLRKGETVVVIATPGHSVQFDAAMAAAGIDLAAVRANGRLVEFDARKTLDSLMSEGQPGNLSAAIRLEGYWNQILAKRRVPLFCAYRASVLGDASNHSPLEDILIMHTQLIPGRGDLEAAVFWLKNNLPDRAEHVIGRARVMLGAESARA